MCADHGGDVKQKGFVFLKIAAAEPIVFNQVVWAPKKCHK